MTTRDPSTDSQLERDEMAFRLLSEASQTSTLDILRLLAQEEEQAQQPPRIDLSLGYYCVR